ncbi:hypothetical protein PUN28_011537 [Cardiocondyla obscurior]|uniref:Uncharacterized protein n=1 Tax=Cardiocondyla obscurior TaxID=286306 RepID=A0AAW2FFN6_9HYME
MIVKNIIIIIFVVTTGTELVRCAVATTKHRPKLKKEGIKHESDNDDSVRALSDFGVVRRSLNPVLFEQHSSGSIQYLKDERNVSNVESKKNIIIEKLKLSVTFRDNMLYVFSYLLHGRENGLTEEQYASLQMLHDFLKKKTVYIYNLLPNLSKLNNADKNRQTSVVLSSLTKNLPPYIQCTAKYLSNEIEMKRIDFNKLIQPTEFETFNYLANIDLTTISKGKIKNEEMTGYNNYSNITQKALGPVFVKLLHDVRAKKIPLSQELFGLILINLPNLSNDPVLEENVRFLYDLTENNVIDRNDWNTITKDLVVDDAYTLVFFILTRILDSNVPTIIRDTASYVYHHLKMVTVPSYVNSNLKYIRHLIEKDIDIGMLLSAINPQDFDSDAIRMKNILLTYFMHNYRNEDMNKILKGFNKFAYGDPLDLLLAFITRLTNRVPSFPNTNSLEQPARALLPALIVQKYFRVFTPFVSPEIDILILLDSLKIPDAGSALRSTVDSIKLELIAQPQVAVLLSTLIPTEKSKCPGPKQCLINTFQQVSKLQNNISLTLTKNIQNVLYTLKATLQPQQQLQPFVAQYSIKPIDVNVYLNKVKPAAVEIETDSTYANNDVLSSIYEGVYVWNIDKYVGKIGPAVSNEVQVETLESTEESGAPGILDSVETKVGTPLYNTRPTVRNEARVTEAEITKTKITEPKVTEAQFTEYISREVTTERPSTTKSVLTTLMFGTPSLTTYSLTQNGRRKHPQRIALSTTATTVEQYNSDIESVERTSELEFHDKEISGQSSTSEEVEETSPPKDVPKKVTTKQLIEVSTTKRTPKHTELETSQEVEEKIEQSSEKVSSAVVLPPSIQTDQLLKVQLSNSGVPVVTTDDDYNATEPEVILPEIKELLKTPEVNNFMQDDESPIVTQVLQPLSAIFGKNYIKKIVKDLDAKNYPTNIALLSTILKKAVVHPEVSKNLRLVGVIHKYITSIEYVSPTILLPIVASSKKLASNVVYSTFNPSDLSYSTIEENPPDKQLSDSITVPLVNPKLLLQSINSSNPYDDLLPTLDEEDTSSIAIQPLKMILTSTKIVELLGRDFQPLAYPNKGALLITLLHKLLKTKMVQSNAKLKYLIDVYIQAIEVPSMSVQISEDNLVKMMSETTGQWQPELTSLIAALPTAKSDVETAAIEELKQFLANPVLLEKLQIDKPPVTMTRGDLLQKIILSALSGKVSLEKRLLKALKYYKDKVDFVNMGALPIIWMWVETHVVKAEIQLGDMIQETINFNELSYKKKIAYNELITYLAQNPNLLQDNEDFDFEKYKTQGQFIKGLFKYLLKKPEVNDNIQTDIQMLLSHVSQTGAGAVLMPSFSGF